MGHTAPMEPARSTRQDMIGILWMLATGLCFVAVNGIVRWLGDELPPAQSAFIRFVFGLVFLAPVLARVSRDSVPVALWPRIGLRGALHVCAVLCWFYAMTRIPIAEVTAIGFLNPIVVTIGAALLLGERVSLARGAAIAVALIGALIVLRPGMRAIDPGHLAQIAAALFFGSSYLVAKPLAERLPATLVVALLGLVVTVGLAPLALWVWVPPTLAQIAALGLVAIFATAAHYTMTRAFAAAPLSVTQPVTFLQLIWASLLGAAVFAEPVDAYVLLGGALMIGAISAITLREARKRRRQITPPPAATKG
ncbi:MAG: DMT family transporter [Paracoccus sp. (in: a-proteobacteria)]|nr:DMT family transporter [Paracoccus sp. (in: a-proteobacteria)]